MAKDMLKETGNQKRTDNIQIWPNTHIIDLNYHYHQLPLLKFYQIPTMQNSSFNMTRGEHS